MIKYCFYSFNKNISTIKIKNEEWTSHSVVFHYRIEIHNQSITLCCSFIPHISECNLSLITKIFYSEESVLYKSCKFLLLALSDSNVTRVWFILIETCLILFQINQIREKKIEIIVTISNISCRSSFNLYM